MTTDADGGMIRIRGARTHNLKSVDVDLPLGKLIVITGVSGSGKSSLAFDTLFAEGQRRYLESVSVHTRSLLKQLPRPEVDEISGLPPTVSVDQRVGTVPARSTLAVTTEIYDYLRLMYARAGTAHCTECGLPVQSQSVSQIVERILQRPERAKLMILAPLVRKRRGAHREVFDRIRRNGFVRARINGELLDVADAPELPSSRPHSIDAVIDRIILKEGIEQRLRESVELAVRESDGTCVICELQNDAWQDQFFSTRFSCADCNLSFPTPEPRSFSFNSAWGACPECEGYGIRGIVDDSSDVTVFRKAPCDVCHGTRLQPFARRVTFANMSISDFTALSVSDALATVQRWQTALAEAGTPDAAGTAGKDKPPAAGGTSGAGGTPGAGGTGDEARPLSQQSILVAGRTLPDIQKRLECLKQVGVGYLTLDRATRTLSGGEFQRARLAACLGTGLYGACFVIDEPTSGLHPRDTKQLLTTLQAIRDAGATVVVVEHDGEAMRIADHLVDLGPHAGVEGGRLIFSGAPADAASAESPTGRYLRGQLESAAATISDDDAARRIQSLQDDARAAAPAQLTIQKARRNNLRQVTVDIPLNRFVCVTGVSGSGKSSLIMECLLPIVEAAVSRDADVQVAAADAECDGVTGLEEIQRVVAVDNSPLGRNRRSCIATYSSVWNEVRRVFARTKEARARGFTARRFSFNSGDGRCAACKGTGVRDVRMHFLPDATIPCPDCRGQRFNRATLGVRFAGANAADVLNMRVERAVEFFSELSSLRHIMQIFSDVGLGYLTLGQPASTFSGGEAQRVRLATELAADRPEPTLFILDEPTSGLHPADVQQLTALLRKLVAAGHSVIVVEHNVDVMRASDWIIDMGPGSAADGGTIVAAGTPTEIARSPASLTAPFLNVPSHS